MRPAINVFARFIHAAVWDYGVTLLSVALIAMKHTAPAPLELASRHA